MNQPTGSERDTEQACLLLREYSFDLGGYRPTELVALWQEQLTADPSWIRSAVVEALYQGRYKAISVEQILRVWKRRGHPLRHFNHEFERVVFGPVDPMASKYAPLTSLRPSELLTPQSDEALEDHTHTTGADTSESAHPVESSSPIAPALLAEQSRSELPSPPAATEPAPVLIAEQPAEPASPHVDLPIATEAPQPPGPQTPTAAPSPGFSQPEPIRKFVPEPESSEFYSRLQSVARHSP